MRVKWTEHAQEQRDEIASYIRQRFGTKHKNQFLQEARNATRILKHSPNIGSIDPLFSDRSATYRSIIIDRLSKMVYRIDDDTIYIVAFWDTRQEPENLAQQAK